MNAEFFVISLLNGVSYGLLLFMLSSGLTLIFSMMGVLNFAHTSFYMLGAYFAYTISEVVGFWPALLIAPVVVGLLGGLVLALGVAVFVTKAPVPFVDKVRASLDLREQVVSFPPQPVITSDNLVVNIDTVIYYSVIDAKSAVYEIANFIQEQGTAIG